MAPSQLAGEDAARLNLRVLKLVTLKELKESGGKLATVIVKFDGAAEVPVFVRLDTSDGRFDAPAASTSSQPSAGLSTVTVKTEMIDSVIHDICTVAGLEQAEGSVDFGLARFRVGATAVRLSGAIENKIDEVLHVDTIPVHRAKAVSWAAAGFPDEIVILAVDVIVYPHNTKGNEDREICFMNNLFSRMNNVVLAVLDPTKFTVNPYQLSWGPTTAAAFTHQGQGQN